MTRKELTSKLSEKGEGMKTIIIMVGNIGSGKTTFVKKLQKEAYIVLSRDALRYSIGAGEYMFNLKYEATIHKVALYMCEEFLKLGVNVVFDETNMSKKSRRKILVLAKKYRYKTIAYLTPKLNREESVKRRFQGNHGNTTKEIWEMVWDKFNKEYEPPTIGEGFDAIAGEE